MSWYMHPDTVIFCGFTDQKNGKHRRWAAGRRSRVGFTRQQRCLEPRLITGHVWGEGFSTVELVDPIYIGFIGKIIMSKLLLAPGDIFYTRMTYPCRDTYWWEIIPPQVKQVELLTHADELEADGWSKDE
jgi:hypothetical protein